VVEVMSLEEGILLGMDSSDELVRDQVRLSLTAVMAPMKVAPDALLFDPETYQFEDFADIGESGATVLYFEGAAYIPFLVETAGLTSSQLDSSYDGTPARFVADGGKDVIAGFVTSEPYKYEHDVEAWKKPLDYLLINDAGYPRYTSMLVTRTEAITEEADCLSLLMPIIQQGMVDYMADPSAINQLIADIVADENAGWSVSVGENTFASDTMRELDMVGMEAGYIGGIDPDRIAEMLEIVRPIYEDAGLDVAEDLQPEDLYTNEFLSPDIGA
jgi:hypothetical protein